MRRRFLFVLFWLFWGVCGVFDTNAFAHTRSQSFSEWQISESDVFFTFSVDARRITQLVPLMPNADRQVSPLSDSQGAEGTLSLPDLAMAHLHDTITLRLTKVQDPCALVYLSRAGASNAIYRFSGKFSCHDKIDALTIRINTFFDVSPTHIHMARLYVGHDDAAQRSELNEIQDFVLKSGDSEIQWSANTQIPSTFGAILPVGIAHVFGGLDHIIFLIALALAAQNIRMVVFCATGFTLGHTAILGLISYGFVTVDMRLVEALIGFTILGLAIEGGLQDQAARRRALSWVAISSLLLAGLSGFSSFSNGSYVAFLPAGDFLDIILPGSGLGLFALALAGYAGAAARLSLTTMRHLLPVMTLLFGLVHGAGFASGFAALTPAQNTLLWSLLGFNIGVELAQLCVLGLVLTSAALLRRVAPALVPLIRSTLGPAIFALGLFWFVTRIWA